MAETPPRLTSALADRYRLERPLGEGGMATVVESRTDLFEYGGDAYIARGAGRSYDVDASGERFLVVRTAGAPIEGQEGLQADMILVQNWFEELRQRLGGGR